MNASKLIEDLIAAGTPARLVVEVARLVERLEFDADRRERDRIRKKNQRLSPRTSADVTGRPVTKEKEEKKESTKERKEERENPSLRSGTPRRASRLPTDWKPLNGDAEFALKILPKDWRIEADKFRDYWIARPGQQGVKQDWSATWRNWLRKAAEQKGVSPELPLERKERPIPP